MVNILHFFMESRHFFIKMETTGVQCCFGQYVKNLVNAGFGDEN